MSGGVTADVNCNRHTGNVCWVGFYVYSQSGGVSSKTCWTKAHAVDFFKKLLFHLRMGGARLLVIDGGFSKAYQPETGIAGYTLVFHSHGLQLVQHEPFQSRQKAIEEGQDIKSTTFIVEFNSQRMMVKDTDKGAELRTQIEDLKKLLIAYRMGVIKERN